MFRVREITIRSTFLECWSNVVFLVFGQVSAYWYTSYYIVLLSQKLKKKLKKTLIFWFLKLRLSFYHILYLCTQQVGLPRIGIPNWWFCPGFLHIHVLILPFLLSLIFIYWQAWRTTDGLACAEVLFGFQPHSLYWTLSPKALLRRCYPMSKIK